MFYFDEGILNIFNISNWYLILLIKVKSIKMSTLILNKRSVFKEECIYAYSFAFFVNLLLKKKVR